MALETRDIFKNPLTRAELKSLLAGRPAGEIFSWKSPRAKAMELEEGKVDDERLLDFMAGNPYLIRRPLIQVDGQLFVGFNSKSLEGLFG